MASQMTSAMLQCDTICLRSNKRKCFNIGSSDSKIILIFYFICMDVLPSGIPMYHMNVGFLQVNKSKVKKEDIEKNL